ncbi:sigma-54 interaction domain-containing protein [Desulfoluna butyratoxydans]|uniref:Rna polymerase sigma factor 54 interaction domain n=1 Tax=Desulfoluna butyratoxydans TaxID=231438 RepID=A0A4U8YLT5_9BACT|nr:sigma 54-interacting transcriptional regulator [Desulfoluna butyratoxydans]VFQ44610.1 rna polymerase sigma factor 54 interaction domain [Desulfoluna butyratoxydans]
MTDSTIEDQRTLFSFDHAPVGIVWHDADGKIIRVNRYAARKLEYAPEELEGNYLYKFVVLDTQKERGSYYGDDPGAGTLHNLFTKHGKVIPVKVLVYGANEDHGDFGCAFFTDLSETVRLAEMLRAFQERYPSHGTEADAELPSEKPREVFRDFIGQSRATGELFRLICSVAPTPTTVLISGETGTGKELVARKIHELSGRAAKKLVKVNCATLPAQLVEGELFGHERGAFTGAHSKKPGRFELAHGGTIFLDEIGEMSLEIQAKLLRVLQEGEFERLGGTDTLKVDVRVIAATNRDLPSLVRTGRFRSDLYFRLSIFPIPTPPLRERKEDIPLLTRFFTENFCTTLNRKHKAVPKTFTDILKAYHWPGNVRELQNVVERACILSTDDSLDPACISFASVPTVDAPDAPLSFEENERRYIASILATTGGKVFGPDGAAAIMKLNPRTLMSKINKLGIPRPSSTARGQEPAPCSPMK